MKSIWHTTPTIDEINERARNSLSNHLGIEFTEIGPDFLSARMPIDIRTIQPMGILHGGATAALAETVGSAAANYCVNPSEKICVGLEINVNHIKSIRSSHVIATAKALHLGKTTQVWDIQIRNAHGDLIAVSRLTMAVLHKK
jgi:1,4-dihydroxy-2-naphthoyl-CoA hydrolase